MVRLVPVSSSAVASMIASRDRYAGIDQVLSARKHRGEADRELVATKDLVHDLLKAMRRARRR
jgi:hypothetical protein